MNQFARNLLAIRDLDPHGAPLPDDALHGAPDDTITHVQFHNAYGLEMGQATYEGLRHCADRAPIRVDTRRNRWFTALPSSGTAIDDSWGISAWPFRSISACLSGFPMTGGDVGGFWQDATADSLCAGRNWAHRRLSAAITAQRALPSRAVGIWRAIHTGVPCRLEPATSFCRI